MSSRNNNRKKIKEHISCPLVEIPFYHSVINENKPLAYNDITHVLNANATDGN